MTADMLDRYEHDRREADAAYNAALTELDRTVQQLARADRTESGALAAFTSALVVFLQQITAFVETKDRQVAAEAARRIEVVTPAVDAIGELRAHVAVLQRTFQALEARAAGSQPSTLSRQPSAVSLPPSTFGPQPSAVSDDELQYVAFEDQFRGSDAEIAERQRGYLPLFAGARDVVDIGCGRGEFLRVLNDAGIGARGVDANAGMAAAARSRGLDVVAGDGLAFLLAQADESLGGVMAAQVVEHLEPAYLGRLLATAGRKLRAGAPIVLETINPACWLAFFSSYIRDLTHVRPIHPDTLQYLVRAHGFERVTIRYSAPAPEPMKMKPAELGVEVRHATDPAAAALRDLVHTVNANAAILNSLLFSYMDYAVIGYKR